MPFGIVYTSVIGSQNNNHNNVIYLGLYILPR